MTNSHRACRRVLGLVALSLASVSPVFAQQPISASADRRTIAAEKLLEGEELKLDGQLDEPFWKRAQVAADFRQIDPRNGQPATEKTEVRVVLDADSLTIGVICYDSEPDKWTAYQRRRDEGLPADDKIRFTIDPLLDARTGYFFEMNPLGEMSDMLMGVNGNNRQWDGIWDARAKITDFGWVLEIDLPFRTLNFNPNNDTWGMNFERTIQRKNEVSIWMGWARNQGLMRMTNAGHVTGISGGTQGLGLDVKPYGLYMAESSPGRGQTSMKGDASAGIDVFYNPTPQLRANFTVNTDFAQTEVDQRQVNLTRYSLFFPEKRDFFLDGAIFFDFGSPANNDPRITPFFSRRIGLGSNGTPQKINYGTKVTGQVGGQDVGLLHVSTGQDGPLVGEDFTVARVKRRMFQQSYIGAIYTRRDSRVPGADTHHTAGADFRLATSRFLGSQNFVVSGWGMQATRPGVSGGKSAFGATVDYPNDRWSAKVDLAEVQKNFDPSMGFVTLQNYRRYAPTLTFAPRPKDHPYIRRFTFNGNTDLQTDLNNQLISRVDEFTVVQIDFHSQDQVTFEMSHDTERLDAPFAISRGITLPAGAEYGFMRWNVRGQTANRRILSLNARFESGDFYSGTRNQTTLNFTVRARPGLIVYMTGDWNKVDLAEGSFTTKLYRVITENQFNPRVYILNNFQYDTQSAVLGWQSRFRWIVKPGNDFYVVYTHNWLDSPVLDRLSTLDRRFATKALYTRRF